MFQDLCLLFSGCCASAVIGALIAHVRVGQANFGSILGFFLGPIGWICCLALKDYRTRCSKCMGIVDDRARICPHCRESLDAPADVYAGAPPSGPAICVACGFEGAATVEMGVARCPKCGRKV